MKKTFFLALTSLFNLNVFSQATYNSPESIEFDYANNRWFIANNGGDNILIRNSNNGALSVFASGFTVKGPHGLEIVDDTLYACAGTNLRAFNINASGTLLFDINLGASFLNGITHDSNGNLYLTDFTGKQIFRFNTRTRQFNVFVSGLSKSPNGIIFDQPNRCIFVNWGTSAPVMALNLADSSASVLTTTTLSNCDGITKDGAGNYYISAWGASATTGKIYKYSSFSSAPVAVVSGLNSPADVFYNTVTDTLGVPNSGTSGGTTGLQNNITCYYFGSATGINEITETNTLKISANPNPVIKTAEINYILPENGKVLIQLFDIKGKLVKTIVEEMQSKGEQMIFFSRSNLAGGHYFLKIETGSCQETQKIIIAE
jgi:hypothetical protein